MRQRIRKRQIMAIIMLVVTLITSLPMGDVYAAGITHGGTTSQNMSGDSLRNIKGGGVAPAGGVFVPGIRIFISRDKELYSDGTPETKTRLENTFATSFPKDAGFGNSLIILPHNQEGRNIVLGEYVAASNSMNYHSNTAGGMHPQITKAVSGGGANVGKQKIQSAGYSTANGKGKRLTELSDGKWREISQQISVNDAKAVWGNIMRVNSGELEIDKNISKAVSTYLQEGKANIKDLKPEQVDDVKAGYLGLLMSLQRIAEDRGAYGFLAKVEQGIEDYVTGGNLENAPVALVMDTVIVLHEAGRQKYMAIPSIDFLQYVGIVTEAERLDVTPDRRVTRAGKPTKTKDQLKYAMADRLKEEDVPYIPGEMSRVVRFIDGRSKAGSVEDSLLKTPIGWGVAVPGWRGERIRTEAPRPGEINMAGPTKTLSGYMGMLKFYGDSEGFMITTFSVGEEPTDLVMEVDNNVGKMYNDVCDPLTYITVPPAVTLRANTKSSTISLALTRLQKDVNYKVKIEGKMYRKKEVRQGNEKSTVENWREMPEMSAEINKEFTKQEAVSFLQGENIVINDIESLESTYERSEKSSTIVRYEYEIRDFKLTLGEKEMSYKPDEIISTKDGLKYNFFEAMAANYIEGIVPEIPDIEIQEPSGPMDLDAPDPSEKENEAIVPGPGGTSNTPSMMVGRYEYETMSVSESDKGQTGTFAEMKNRTPGSEKYEALAGMPSTEEIYFSAGGEEFKLAVIFQHWVNEHSKDRTYRTFYTGTKCEYNAMGVDTWVGGQTAAQPRSAGNTSPSGGPIQFTHRGGTVTITWSGTEDGSCTYQSSCSFTHSGCSIPARANYNDAVAAAEELKAALESGVQFSHTAGSDKKTRNWNFSESGGRVSISKSHGSNGRAGRHGDSKSCSGKPSVCVTIPHGADSPGQACDPSFTVSVTITLPECVVCGPCCDHELPLVEDTWRQGLVFDYVKLNQVRLYKIDQASVKGMKELVGTDEIVANIKSGDPTFFFNAAQLTEQHYNRSPIIPMKVGNGGLGSDPFPTKNPKETKNTYLGNSRETMSNGISRRQEAQSSKAGRIRYSLEPAQHDEVVWNEGVRTNVCDGIGKTKNYNVEPAGGLGHDPEQPWAKGILYTNPAKGKTFKGYSEHYNHHMNRDDNEDKSRYDDKADSIDIKTPEWQKFDERRRMPNQATVISDFLILQTSGGDQSIFYYEQDSEIREAQWHFPKVKTTSEEFFTNNENSIWAAKDVCGSETGLKVNEPYINIGGYNGRFREERNKYKPYNAGQGGYVTSKKQVKTKFDNDPAGTVVRPARPGELKLMEDRIQILPTARNKPYQGVEAQIFYKQALAYFSIDDTTKTLDGGTQVLEDVNIGKVADTRYDEQLKIWGDGVGLTYPTKYNADGKELGINPVVVYTPVSTEDATILPIDDLNIKGQRVSRDQRTEESLRVDLAEQIRELQVCPQDPGMCDHRVLNCKYTQDIKLASFDFEGDSVYKDGSSWVVKNKVTGMDHRLPSGFTVGSAGKLPGSYLNAKGTRWSIPFSEIGLSSKKQNRVYVEMDMYMDSNPTNDPMLVSFAGYGFQLKPRDSNILGEFSTSLDGAGLKGTKKVRGNGKNRKVRVGLEFSLNNIMDNRAWVDGVEVKSNVIKEDLVTVVEGGVNKVVKKVVEVRDIKDAPQDLVTSEIGQNLNIGSWGKDNKYPSDYYIDNIEIWLKGGNHEHDSTCYTSIALHERRKIHVHTDACRSNGNDYDNCKGELNYYGTRSCGKSTSDYTCGLTESGSGRYDMVADNDDGGGYNQQGLKREAYISHYLKAGQSIKIQMGGYRGGDGVSDLKVNGPGYSRSFYGRSYSGYYEGSGSFIHEFVVETSGTYTFETFDSTKDPYLGLYVRDGHRHVSECRHKHSGSPSTSANGCYTRKNEHRHSSACGNKIPAGDFKCKGLPVDTYSINNVHVHTKECIDKEMLAELSTGGADAKNPKTFSRGTGQKYTVPATGTYLLEVWGAEGGTSGYGGKGGYSKGEIKLTKGQVITVNVGGQDGTNGGGSGARSQDNGGGASDIRVGGTSLSNRVIVAGGGGGYGGNSSRKGGDGGGTSGDDGSGTGSGNTLRQGGIGGNQSRGGAGGAGVTTGRAGSLGYGGDAKRVGSRTAGGGGGGGYYGGGSGGNDYSNYDDADDGGGGGGSGYIGKVSKGSMSKGVRSGNGQAKITPKDVTTVGGPIGGKPVDKVLGTNWKDYVSGESYDTGKILTNSEKLPQKNNPLFGKCLNVPNTHVCSSKCRTTRILNCTEPHHKGGHYDGSDRICWDACGIDSNHANKDKIVLGDGRATKGAKFVQMDYEFTVYFPNRGDFAGNGAYGLPVPQRQTGRGYTNRMDTTEWTREKRVRFPYNVIHEGKMYRAGEWVELEVKEEYFDFYIPIANQEASNAPVEFEVEAINNGVSHNRQLDYSTRVYNPYPKAVENYKKSLPSKWISTIDAGFKINYLSDQNYADWFRWKQSQEQSKLTTVIRRMKTDIWSEFRDINEKAKPVTTNDNYEAVNNKARTSVFESLHGGYKVQYVDVLGRIGNFTIQDTEDYRFSNLFKLPKTNPPEWLIEGFIYKVDQSIQNYYLGDDYDIRGNKISPKTRWLDTYGTQDWMTGELQADGGRDINKPNKVGSILTADVNNIAQLREEQLRHGYDIYTSIVTMGNYASADLSITPYYYVMEKETGNIEPVDVYISKEGVYKVVNKFGAEGSDLANLEKYNFNLDWIKERERRNYTLQEKFETDKAIDYLTVDLLSDGEMGSDFTVIGKKYPDTPKGNSNYMGTAQHLLLDGKHRTFIGSEDSYGNPSEQNKWGINKNPGNRLPSIEYTVPVQRWHYKLGVPSSAVFVKKGQEPNKETIEEVMNDDNVIILTTSILAQGGVWTLEYKQPWMTHIEVEGKLYNISNKNLPPIVGIYSGKGSAIEDVEVIKTH